MTYEKLINKFTKYNIPTNARLMSDSGWEVDATDMDGIYYNKKLNIVVFRQDFGYNQEYTKENGWEELL